MGIFGGGGLCRHARVCACVCAWCLVVAQAEWGISCSTRMKQAWGLAMVTSAQKIAGKKGRKEKAKIATTPSFKAVWCLF
uniref:Putative secreted protein n=1 Tax=Anopheles marajoara TaxID=58244 RepID=A0A2M4CC30_9DIPT